MEYWSTGKTLKRDVGVMELWVITSIDGIDVFEQQGVALFSWGI
jgi:hypothetical protein